AHETHWSRRGAAAGEELARAANSGEVGTRAGAPLEDDSLFDVPVEDRAHRVLDSEDEACGCLLGDVLHANVEPDRRVERGLLIHDQELELFREGRRLLRTSEVAILLAPRGDGVDDTVD